jgi:hypothetical protein
MDFFIEQNEELENKYEAINMKYDKIKKFGESEVNSM